MKASGNSHVAGLLGLTPIEVTDILLDAGCSAGVARMVWDHEVAGSNPATPTRGLVT